MQCPGPLHGIDGELLAVYREKTSRLASMEGLTCSRRVAAGLSSALTAAVAVPLLVMSLTVDSGAWAWSLGVAGIWICGALILHAVVPARRTERMGEPKALAVACALGAGLSLAAFVGALVMAGIPWISSWVTDPADAARRANLWLLLPAALLAGAGEELFFRLSLPSVFRGEMRRYAPVIAYVVVTGFTGSLGLTVMALILGIVTAYGLYMTGRWYVPLVIHSLWTVTMIGLFPFIVS